MDHGVQVAAHYNARKNQDLGRRRESPIYHLKAFNNWIKAILFQKYVRPGERALDIACGKGGDLKKWANARIQSLVGLGTFSPADK